MSDRKYRSQYARKCAKILEALELVKSATFIDRNGKIIAETARQGVIPITSGVSGREVRSRIVLLWALMENWSPLTRNVEFVQASWENLAALSVPSDDALCFITFRRSVSLEVIEELASLARNHLESPRG